MPDIKTEAENDYGYKIILRVDEEDAEMMLAWTWNRLFRPQKMLLGVMKNSDINRKSTRPTTLLRTKYERTGEALSQLVRIKMPKIKYGMIVGRIFDFRKCNLICRQSAFPTVGMTFQEYVDRYKKANKELVPIIKAKQLVLPGVTLPTAVGRYPAKRAQVFDTDIGPMGHIENCFKGNTIPGLIKYKHI